MPFIISATDFSSVADNAVKYACDLALAQNADVTILHTYSIPLTLGEMTVPLPASEFREDAEITLNKLIAELGHQYPQITFRKAVIYGNVIDAINGLIGDDEPPMFVLVGNSYSQENTSWMDSTLLEAFRSLKFPILAIPPDSQYEQVRKIGFVYDNELGGSEHALQQLAQLALTLGAELHIHNNQREPEEGEMNVEINNGARGLLMPANPLYHYSFGEDVDSSILDFVAKYHLDWLILMPRGHSFFENLFHKSHTKAIVNTSYIPIMALHETDV